MKNYNKRWAYVNLGPTVILGRRYVVTEDGELFSNRSDGRVRDFNDLRPMKGYPDRKGYLKVKLYGLDGRKYNTRIHRLVLESFTRKGTEHFFNDVPMDFQVDHINQNPSDNRLGNLRWVTNTINASNRKHSYHSWSKSTKNEICKLYFEKRRGYRDIGVILHITPEKIRQFLNGYIHEGYAENWCKEHGYEYKIRAFSLPIKWENGRSRKTT